MALNARTWFLVEHATLPVSDSARKVHLGIKKVHLRVKNAEIELSVLSRQCLNRRFEDRDNLEQEVQSWEEARNKQATTVNWQFRTEDARVKLKRLYPKWVNLS